MLYNKLWDQPSRSVWQAFELRTKLWPETMRNQTEHSSPDLEIWSFNHVFAVVKTGQAEGELREARFNIILFLIFI